MCRLSREKWVAMFSSDRKCLRRGSLASRPRPVPKVARGSRRARPRGPRSRGGCRIMRVRGLAGRGVGSGGEGRASGGVAQARGVALGARRAGASAQACKARHRAAGGRL